MLLGSAEIFLGDEQATLEAGDCIVIQANTPHKIWNLTDKEAVFIAVCLPAWEVGNSVFLE